jgi:hypothetical protein
MSELKLTELAHFESTFNEISLLSLLSKKPPRLYHGRLRLYEIILTHWQLLTAATHSCIFRCLFGQLDEQYRVFLTQLLISHIGHPLRFILIFIITRLRRFHT